MARPLEKQRGGKGNLWEHSLKDLVGKYQLPENTPLFSFFSANNLKFGIITSVKT